MSSHLRPPAVINEPAYPGQRLYSAIVTADTTASAVVYAYAESKEDAADTMLCSSVEGLAYFQINDNPFHDIYLGDSVENAIEEADPEEIEERQKAYRAALAKLAAEQEIPALLGVLLDALEDLPDEQVKLMGIRDIIRRARHQLAVRVGNPIS